MAKRGALTHRKTRRLAIILGIEVPCALGLREALWHVTAEQARTGNIGRMSDQAIADEMFYTGDAETLIEALIKAEVIDRDGTHRLITHGWSEHSDDAVHMAMARAREFFADGTAPRYSRLPPRERDAAEAYYVENCAHGARTACARCHHDVSEKAHSGCPPEPRQCPASASKNKNQTKPLAPVADDELRPIAETAPVASLAEEPVVSFTACPDDFAPGVKAEQFCQANGLDLDEERQKFVLHNRGRGTTAANWDAMFESWLIKARNFAQTDRARQRSESPRASPPRNLTAGEQTMENVRRAIEIRKQQRGAA